MSYYKKLNADIDNHFLQRPTIVDGQETGNITESGNNNHDSLGRFTSPNQTTRGQKESLLQNEDFDHYDVVLNTVIEELEEETGLEGDELIKSSVAILAYTRSGFTEAITNNFPMAKPMIECINKAIYLMPKYRDKSKGEKAEHHYRGMAFDITEKEKFKKFLSLEVGQEVPSLNGIQSWTSNYKVAKDFTYEEEAYNVILVCSNNKTGAPIKHISYFPNEDEILKPSFASHIVKNKILKKRDTSYYLYIEVEEK